MKLLQISGLGLLIAGIVVLNDVMDFNHFLDQRITAPPIILIVTGLIIFGIAFLGCYGALKESPKLLMMVSFLNKILLHVKNQLSNMMSFSVCVLAWNNLYHRNRSRNRCHNIPERLARHFKHTIANDDAPSKQGKWWALFERLKLKSNLFIGWHGGLGRYSEENDVLRARWAKKLVWYQQRNGFGNSSELL